MDYQYKEWEKKLDSFQDLVQKNMEEMKNCKADLEEMRTVFDLDEMRKCKADMQKMRAEMADYIKAGRYIHDDQRLILSAPEIIIGNVDPFGVLKDKSESKIILRGTQVSTQAVGEKGQVEVRASRIREVAEDPGIDGCEHVMGRTSDIISQARHVVIETNENSEFSKHWFNSDDIGINILSDSSVSIGALHKRERIGSESLTVKQRDLIFEASRCKDDFKDVIDRIKPFLEMKEQLLKEEYDIRVYYPKLDKINEQINLLMKELAEKAYGYYMSLSELAENNRFQNLLDYIEAASHEEEDDFKKYSTGTSVDIASETIALTSKDGDDNLRDNPGAGIRMKANQISMEACENDGKLKENGSVSIKAKDIDMATAGRNDIKYDDDGTVNSFTNLAEGHVKIQSKNISLESLDYELTDNKYKVKQVTPDSSIKLRSKNIEVSTVNVANMEIDDEGNLSKANFTAEGDVIIRSKTFSMESTDFDFENGEVKEKSLTKGSKVSFRTEKMDFSATEADGMATGSASINAKDIAITSMDVNEKDRTKDTISYDGTLSLMTNKIDICTAESLQLQGQKIGVFADDTAEFQQGDGQSALRLSGGDVLLGGSKNEVVGDVEINGKLVVPEASIDNLEVKTSLKTPNITDGVSVPGAPAGSLSTQLQRDSLEDLTEAMSKYRTEDEDDF